MGKYKIGDLGINDRIALAAIATLGKSVAKSAFLLTHNIETKNEASLGVMVSRWMNSDKAKEFMASIRSGTASAIAADETNDLTTRQGVINQLIVATSQTSGKDSISGLQTLAKIQGYDRPSEEKPEEERRRFYLPWVSHCRSCRLMAIFQELQKQEESNFV